MVRILGIDPGTRVLGYGVIEIPPGGGGLRLVYVECGVLKVPATAPLAERLGILVLGLQEIVRDLAPHEVAVEDVFHAVNARSALALGHARGAALAVAGLVGLPVSAYPPALVKKNVTGSGRAAKQQVGEMMRALLGLKTVPRPDAADALAVAISHAYARGNAWARTTRVASPDAIGAAKGSSRKIGLSQMSIAKKGRTT